MPHGFEYIVRPYQAPGSQNAAVIPSTPKGTRERAHLVWGGKGTLPEIKTLYPSTVVNLCRESLNEQGRDNESVRIVGNDGESYVDVDRPTTVRLEKLDKSSDGAVSSTGYTTNQKLDSRLPADRFSTPADSEWKSSWKSGWGTCNVTWNLTN